MAVQQKQRVNLSPTAVIAYENCSQGYKYRYVDRTDTEGTPANLVFGDAIHTVVENVVRAQMNGDKGYSGRAAWDSLWKSKLDDTPDIVFGKQMDAEDLRACGELLIKRFETAWPNMGLRPMRLDDGTLMMEKYITVPLGDNTFLRGKADMLAYDRNGGLVVVDWKTAASAHVPMYASLSDQLAAYVVMVEGSTDIPVTTVDRVGFVDFLKRKVPKANTVDNCPDDKGPRVVNPCIVDRPTDEALDLFRAKCLTIADDIRRGRFFRQPGHSYNSPCAMCDYSKKCLSEVGLVLSDDGQVTTDLFGKGAWGNDTDIFGELSMEGMFA